MQQLAIAAHTTQPLNNCAPTVKSKASSSVQFSHSVMSDFLWPHGLQHARLPCPSPTPRACSNSCPLSRWCHPTISSSVVPFSSCLQSFPGSGSFPMRQFFASGGQTIGVSPSTSFLPMNIQDWFPLFIHLKVHSSIIFHLLHVMNCCCCSLATSCSTVLWPRGL